MNDQNPHSQQLLFTPRFPLALALLLLLSLPALTAEPKEGLHTEIYNLNEVHSFPSIGTQSPDISRTTTELEFSNVGDWVGKEGMGEHVYIQWEGQLTVEESGEYEFFTESDDGSRLLIDCAVVVDNGGQHGMEEKSGTLHLEKGSHNILIRYFQGGGGSGMNVSWKPPNGSKERIPSSVLSYKPLPEEGGSKFEARWNVDDDQYLLYNDDPWNVFDVFGYELAGEDTYAPHPGIGNAKEQVPEYLALFLPNRDLHVGDTFLYSRSLDRYDDHWFYPFNRHLPSKVDVEGSVKKADRICGQRTYVIHQEIEAKMERSYFAKIKNEYSESGDWSHFVEGTMELDVWFDPEAGLVRKISYSADLSFSDDDHSESETYVLSRNHKIAANRNGTGFQAQIQKAIQDGVSYLKEAKNDNSSTWGEGMAPHWDGEAQPIGETALVALTMLKCEVPKDETIIKETMDWLLQHPPKRTYDTGLSIMAFEAYKENPLVRRIEQKYINQKISREEYKQVLNNDSGGKYEEFSNEEDEWLEDQTNFLVKTINSSGGWHYQQGEQGDDNSNSQYGALGLHSAARMGKEVPPDTWKQMMQNWIESQAPGGHGVDLKLNVLGEGQTSVGYQARARGWGYTGPPTPEGKAGKKIYGDLHSSRVPMIMGGVGSLQIGLTNLAKMKRLTPKLRNQGRQAILDGWAWMQAHWSLRPDPGHGWWQKHYYGLYGLERAGMFTRTLAIGQHNWYNEGAELLLSRQQGNGSWNDNFIHTCFALLFLKRATTTVATLGH